MIKKIESIYEVYDFVKKLSYNESTASYPRILNDEHLINVLKSSIKRETDNLIACYDKEDKLVGVSSYTWESTNNFMQTTIFLIIDDYDNIADEIISYFKTQLTNYNFYIGFPRENKLAVNYFSKKNKYPCIEDSVATYIKNFKNYKKKYNFNLVHVNKENFSDYADFHDPIAKNYGIFYDAKNLLDYIDEFVILGLKDNDNYIASIFFKAYENITTVFGLFLDEQYKSMNKEDILIDGMLEYLSNTFCEVGEIIYFIDQVDQNQLKAAYNLGFEKKENYCCYLVK